MQSISQGAVTTTFTLDPDGRRSTETAVNSSTSTTTTTTDHYTNSSDNPVYVTEVSGGSTQFAGYVGTLSNVTAVINTSSGATSASLDLGNLSGSVVATIAIPSTGHATTISSLENTDEYGNIVGSSVTTGVLQHGWQGTSQREVSNAGLTLMGARVYNPTVGRFTSVDPITGGNSNAYNYPDDPINLNDVSGKVGFWVWLAVEAVKTILHLLIVGLICGLPAVGAVLCVVASAVVGAILGGAAAGLEALWSHDSKEQILNAVGEGLAVGFILGLFGKVISLTLGRVIVNKIVVLLVNFITKRW